MVLGKATKYSKLVPEESLTVESWKNMKFISFISQKGNGLEGILYKIIMSIVSSNKMAALLINFFGYI